MNMYGVRATFHSATQNNGRLYSKNFNYFHYRPDGMRKIDLLFASRRVTGDPRTSDSKHGSRRGRIPPGFECRENVSRRTVDGQ